MAKYRTISEAAHAWVNEMNSYPRDMIETLILAKTDEWEEVTEPAIGDSVFVYSLPDGCEDYANEGEIENEVGDAYIVKLHDGNTIEVCDGDFEVWREEGMPMWGWMWSFKDSADEYWMDVLDGIKKMSECGFRIYHNEDWGYFFGIDGAGYDFYEDHWIPLYKARGLKWHDA